ncbi:hypothetical protein C8J48_2985 [Desmospora activa DSM 45169]|uniref:Uncharacterized protein n=1 Tax=Desmospora activa DSM 45169 TaxID=1121389 RepID=A0A2T4Z454_9BACL|nr:hypothetical protein C8J48_2985 [Desmospora activa DSM 45169]
MIVEHTERGLIRGSSGLAGLKPADSVPMYK